MAETKKDAFAAFDAFVETWGAKYDKAVECLIKDLDALLAFYDFPAEHWKHLRTTNVIESSFATVRHAHAVMTPVLQQLDVEIPLCRPRRAGDVA
jgi:transposase-like protein